MRRTSDSYLAIRAWIGDEFSCCQTSSPRPLTNQLSCVAHKKDQDIFQFSVSNPLLFKRLVFRPLYMLLYLYCKHYMNMNSYEHVCALVIVLFCTKKVSSLVHVIHSYSTSHTVCTWLTFWCFTYNLMPVYSVYMDGLVQDFSITSALAMETLQFCTNPSIITSLKQRKHKNAVYPFSEDAIYVPLYFGETITWMRHICHDVEYHKYKISHIHFVPASTVTTV